MIYIKNKTTNEIQELDTSWALLSKDIRDQNDLLDENNANDLHLINSDLLEKAKADKLLDLEKNRKTYQYQNVTYNANNYIASKIAADNITGIYAIMDRNNIASYDWRTADNNKISLSLSDFNAISLLIAAQYSNAYDIEANKILEINNASTIEQLNEIDITF